MVVVQVAGRSPTNVRGRDLQEVVRTNYKAHGRKIYYAAVRCVDAKPPWYVRQERAAFGVVLLISARLSATYIYSLSRMSGKLSACCVCACEAGRTLLYTARPVFSGFFTSRCFSFWTPTGSAVVTCPWCHRLFDPSAVCDLPLRCCCVFQAAPGPEGVVF